MSAPRVPSWESATIGDLFDLIGGGTPARNRAEYWGGGLPWISSADVDQRSLELTPRRMVTESGIKASATKPVPEGSVVVVTRVGLGKIGLSSTQVCFSQDCQALLPRSEFDSRFTAYQMLWIARGFSRISRGTTVPGITKKQLHMTKFAVPPLSEQLRIVAKIEDLFARLEAGIAALKRAQANLERYQASVLKAAVEGKLTERWREKNPPKETGAELLERILAGRQRRWEEEQLAKFTATGRRPPKNWKLRYKEPAGPDTSKLPELPDSWCWATVDQLAASMTNGIYKPARFYSEDGIPCLRMYNIVNGELALDKLKRMFLSEEEVSRYGLVCGDVLINRVNTRELVGKAAAIPDGLNDIVFESKNIRLRPIGMGYEPRFLAYCFFVLGPAYFGRHSQQVVGMASISQDQVGRLIVPVPPSSEQRRIVSVVDDWKRCVGELEETTKIKLDQSQTLRQAILKRAFEGGLVPQDPNDEPASVLLERIQAERDAKRKKRQRRASKPKRKRKSQVA